MKNAQLFTAMLLAGAALAVPYAPGEGLLKRYAKGFCGVHLAQSKRANDADLFAIHIFDNDGNDIGDCAGPLSEASDVICTGQLAAPIRCKQTAETHEAACCFETQAPYCFGIHIDDTGYGCSVGAFDGDGERQADCGFAC